MKKLVLLILSVILVGNTFAQSCNCDITITKEGGYDGKYLGYKAGQTICIQSGSYKYFYFKNIVGTAAQPIKIINCGGEVIVGTDAGQGGIQFYDSKFVKLTGSGDGRYKYGIRLTKTPVGSGLVVTGFSSDFEIERTDVSGTNFAGIMIKTDPNCDPATWRGAFAMYNIKVHGNYVHDTVGEGMYIGNSFWNTGMAITCQGVSKTVFPHAIYGLQIYNNITERTGAEGIQYACAPNSQVYNNVVKFAGIAPFALYQNNGIQGSGGVSGRLSNNIIQHVAGNGIVLLGHSGTNLVYNNLITDVGGIGVFCDNRPNTPSGSSVVLTNNTVSTCGSDGFRLYNDLDITTLTNNVVIQAGTGKMMVAAPGVRVNQQANHYQLSLHNALGNKVIDSDYKPLAGSPLVDKGIVNKNVAITYDLTGKPRPQGAGMDIGAYELQTSGGRLGANGEEITDGAETDLLRIFSFPSPCTNELSVRLNNNDAAIAEVKIYTIQGTQLGYTVPEQPAQEVRLQTHDLPVGEYIYRVVTTDAKTLSGRFIKQ